jgi:glutathione S-transferase
MKLYSAPRTRALRVAWCLEELNAPYKLHSVTFKPTGERFFIQDTPTGKIPTLEDGALVMCESGAIVQYLLDKFSDTTLRPPIQSTAHGEYLQWFHFAEATAFSPIGVVVWLTTYRTDAADHPGLTLDARTRATTTLRQVDEHLAGRTYLAGDAFGAADIMMGFTLLAATSLGLADEMAHMQRYLQRLTARPAFQRAAGQVGGFER